MWLAHQRHPTYPLTLRYSTRRYHLWLPPRWVERLDYGISEKSTRTPREHCTRLLFDRTIYIYRDSFRSRKIESESIVSLLFTFSYDLLISVSERGRITAWKFFLQSNEIILESTTLFYISSFSISYFYRGGRNSSGHAFKYCTRYKRCFTWHF